MKFSEEIIEKLKDLAHEAVIGGEIPVSAVIFDSNFNIISCARNNRQETGNILGHAEVLSIIEAEKLIGDWRLNGYFMVVNLEPCTMCSAIIKESRLDKVFYFVKKDDLDHVIDIDSEQVVGYDNEKLLFKELLTSFFEDMR